jgi:protein TonB
MVVLEALIGKDGAIDGLRLVSGHPLLSQAALDAVKQWRYRPTILNSEPVEVVTTVTVTFTLQ